MGFIGKVVITIFVCRPAGGKKSDVLIVVSGGANLSQARFRIIANLEQLIGRIDAAPEWVYWPPRENDRADYAENNADDQS